MATQYAFGQIVTSGLVLSLDAADRNSYPLGPQLVTNANLLNPGDGLSVQVIRTATGSINANNLGTAVSGSRYRMVWTVTADRGSIGASLRIGGTANTSPAVGVKAVGTYSTTFTALATGGLSINGDNAGCDFDLDYVLIQTISDTWTDMSGNENNGVLTNGPTFNSNNGGSIVLDGVDDFIIDSTTTNIPVGSSSRTVQMWVYPTTNLNSFIQLGTGGGGNQVYVVQYYIVTGVNYLFTDGVNGQNNLTITGDELPTLNSWNNIAFGNSGQNWFYYLNGVLKKQGTWTVTLNTVGQKYILGKRDDTVASPMTGRIASTQLYNRALSASEILQNYNAQKARFGL